MDNADPSAEAPATLSLLEGRVLGCLIEKEFTTPDVYPLTLNALVNACNQKSNRDPVLDVSAREVEVALDGLRHQQLAGIFSGANAHVPKFKQKLDEVYPVSDAARAVLGELLLRGPQTLAGLRANAERMFTMPAVDAFPGLIAELAERPSGALVRQLPRQPGQKEARWAQLLTGEPAVAATLPSSPAEPLKVAMTLPPAVEQRLTALEGEVKRLNDELTRLKQALGEG